MKRVKRPYHLTTETLSAFYETEAEAMKQHDYWISFYKNNIGKYGTHEIKVVKGKKIIVQCVVEG